MCICMCLYLDCPPPLSIVRLENVRTALPVWSPVACACACVLSPCRKHFVCPYAFAWACACGALSSMRLEKLKETLPVWNPRMDTATMLDEAIEFITSLRRDNRRLEVENEILLKALPPGTPRPHVVVNEKMEIQVLHAAPP